jgi:hypothetical protein
MRTTIRLDDGLIERAKRFGLDRGKTFTTIVREALVAYLARNDKSPRSGKVNLPTSGHGGLQPGVNLDDTANLLDIMDERP